MLVDLDVGDDRRHLSHPDDEVYKASQAERPSRIAIDILAIGLAVARAGAAVGVAETQGGRDVGSVVALLFVFVVARPSSASDGCGN